MTACSSDVLSLILIVELWHYTLSVSFYSLHLLVFSNSSFDAVPKVIRCIGYNKINRQMYETDSLLFLIKCSPLCMVTPIRFKVL